MNMSPSTAYSATDAMNKQLAIDPNQTGLRSQMVKDPKGAAKAVASQFEALLMGTLLKSMRETKFDPSNDSSEMDTYRGMLDDQMVQSLSKSGSLGIGNMLYKQIAKLSGFDTKNDPVSLQRAASGPVLPMRGSLAGGLKAYQQAQNEAASAGASTSSSSAGSVSGSAGTASTDGKAFASNMMPYASQAASQLGVAPEFLVAHAALESGWGKRSIRNGDGSNSHNLFGIKASGDWQGKSTSITTTEYVNGSPQKKVEKFRSYDSYADAFSDYAKMLKDSPRYQGALNQGRNVYGFAHGLQSGGYATDPRYANKLVDVAASLAQQSVRS